MTINQERAKQDILESLDDETAFIVIDFAMKFLARRYRESMANWFGKAGMGMHVSCVVIKQPGGKDDETFKKRTYITFIGIHYSYGNLWVCPKAGKKRFPPHKVHQRQVRQRWVLPL